MREALAAAAASRFRSTVATCDCGVAPPAPAAPDASAGVRVSTGAFLSSSLTLEQPASNAAKNKAPVKGCKVLIIGISPGSTAVRPPYRLANVEPGRQQPRLDLAIQRGGHQHVASLKPRRVNEQPAVRRKARAFVVI